MGGYAFEAVLVRPEGIGTWIFLLQFITNHAQESFAPGDIFF